MGEKQEESIEKLKDLDFAKMERLASIGDPEGLLLYGKMRFEGIQCDRDILAAIANYEMAASLGNLEAKQILSKFKGLDKVTINAHSSIRIADSKVLYFDPFQMEKEPKDADLIFITHEHFDHFDPVSIAKVRKEETHLIAPASMKEKVLTQAWVKPENCSFVEPQKEYEIAGIKVQTIWAYNRQKPFHPKENKWVGYVVTMDDVTYYVAGDTDGTNEMKQVICDVACIPVGGKFTMDAHEAADYVRAFMPTVAIPTHYGAVAGNLEDGYDFAKLVTRPFAGVIATLKM